MARNTRSEAWANGQLATRATVQPARAETRPAAPTYSPMRFTVLEKSVAVFAAVVLALDLYIWFSLFG